MCGICGVVGDVDEARLWAMANSMEHRGPDGAGVRCFGGSGDGVRAGLGHRRLSIIDPTPRGAQPMGYANERYWITYNGEIYNFRELRAGLEREGFPFQSDCDTEVLLALYARDGAAMLRQLNGIFAFGIWDTERRELFLARDRMGVKPLYYHQHGGEFSFASEVKALIAGGLRPRMSHTAMADFLTFLWVPDPATMFDGVFKLPPGHYGVLADGRLAITQYWDLEFPVDDGPGGAEWATQVRGAVSSAVRRQRVSDVPLGSFLSGGIDSSAIVAELSSVAAPVTTFTVGFSPEDLRHEIVPDDVKYARKVAEQFKTDYHERVLDAEIVDLLPKLVWHMDEPVADPAAITTYLICAEAREKLTVILSGMGGDEIFAGYPRYLAARLAHTFDLLPTPVRARMRAVTEEHLTLGRPGRMRAPRRNLLKLVRGLDQTFHDRYLTYSSYYKSDELERLLSGDLRREIASHDPYARHRAHLAKVDDAHWLNQLLYLDAKTFLPCLNLTYTDKMSMAASTEVRVPFLDDELVELAARIPPRLKLHHTQRKYVFKQSMRGVLSEDVIWRPKAGFGAPVRSWLSNELRPLVDEMLSSEATAARGLLDPAEVQRIVDADRAGTEDNALRVWALLHLELWQRTFVDPGNSVSGQGIVARRTSLEFNTVKAVEPMPSHDVPADSSQVRVAFSHVPRNAGRPLILIGPVPPPYHGVAVMTSYLAEALDKLGLLAARVDTSDPQDLHTIGMLNLPNVLLAFRHAWNLHTTLRRNPSAGVLLPISQGSYGFMRDAVFVLVIRLHRRRLILHLHGGGLAPFYARSTRAMQLLIRGVFRQADASWALTAGLERMFDGLAHPSRVHHLENVSSEPPPLEPEIDEPDSPNSEMPFRLLYLGNLVPEKGVFNLVAALERIGSDASEWRIRIVGVGSPLVTQSLREKIADLGSVGPVIDVVPGLFGEEKWMAYREADVFVFPTYYEPEGQPLVLLEAMAAGLPIITTPQGGISETVRNEVEGLLVKQGDIDGLARALMLLASDPDLRSSLARAARARYQDRYRPERLERDLASLLRS